jgi:integrase
VVSDDDLRKQLKGVRKPTFKDRDEVAICAPSSRAAGASEVAGLKVENGDFDEDLVYVVGKGRGPRRSPSWPRPGTIGWLHSV